MEELLNLFDNLLSSFDTLENKVEELDFTKKEDIEKLDAAIENLKSSSIVKLFISDEVLDNISKKAHQIYDESNKKKLSVQPSLNVEDKIKNQITNLATEYVNTVIYPNLYSELDPKKYKDLVDSLTDFGCWIYKK